jgi:DNA-directed RNA polymerase specialized sigma24 family protein
MLQSHPVRLELPYLRRYARALTGSQKSGDAYVRATLEALLEGGSELLAHYTPKVALYRTFHTIWANVTEKIDYVRPGEPRFSYEGAMSAPDSRLQSLRPGDREAMLLTMVEGFSASDAAEILGCSMRDVEALVADAQQTIESQLRTRVLIIEDESIIALDLARILGELGHDVVGTAPTKSEAVRIAKAERPGLVLADIRLADGSSGVDATGEILKSFDVPVIFITAYPEHLLTGERPEPTYLITKPFLTNTVMATISQALFFYSPKRLAS